MQTIRLKNTALDDLRTDAPSGSRRWYYGCGPGRLGLDDDGTPVSLVYDDPDEDWPQECELTGCATVLRGMVSCWEFCCLKVR